MAEQLAELDCDELAHDDRPYLVLNFATTLDGRAAIDGTSGPIGSATDTEILQRLRTRVDAVMIGAGTMRAERYGRIVSDPDLRAYREQTGLAHDPLGVIVSNRLDLPWDAGLFTDGGGRVVVFTASDEEPPETATPVTVVRHEDRVDLPKAMEWLRGEGGIRSVLCEGGPHLHGELRAVGLADELFLTIAPKLAGGEAPRILEGALGERLALRSWSGCWSRRASCSPATATLAPSSFHGMDFKPSPAVESLLERIEAFMDEHVYPNEAEVLKALDDEVKPGVPYPQILIEMRAKAREEGLWNLFIADEEHGAGLTNWEYGMLCEQMGRSPVAAPMSFNCSAPGHRQRRDPDRPRHRRAEGASSCSRCSRARRAAASR